MEASEGPGGRPADSAGYRERPEDTLAAGVAAALERLIGLFRSLSPVDRAADPADGRVVQVRITADGRAMLAGRRALRAERVAGLLDRLSPDERAALAAALPAMDALVSAERAQPAAAGAPVNAERAQPAAGALADAQRAEPTAAGLTIGER
jgi:hypothetical protein